MSTWKWSAWAALYSGLSTMLKKSHTLAHISQESCRLASLRPVPLQGDEPPIREVKARDVEGVCRRMFAQAAAAGDGAAGIASEMRDSLDPRSQMPPGCRLDDMAVEHVEPQGDVAAHLLLLTERGRGEAGEPHRFLDGAARPRAALRSQGIERNSRPLRSAAMQAGRSRPRAPQLETRDKPGLFFQVERRQRVELRRQQSGAGRHEGSPAKASRRTKTIKRRRCRISPEIDRGIAIKLRPHPRRDSRTHCTIWPAGSAPDWRAISWPSRNRIIVGMERMPFAADSSGAASVSSLASRTLRFERPRRLLELRRHGPARSAPRRPEIDEHRYAAARHVLAETRAIERGRMPIEQRMAALAASRTRRRLPRRYPVDGRTGRTDDLRHAEILYCFRPFGSGGAWQP